MLRFISIAVISLLAVLALPVGASRAVTGCDHEISLTERNSRILNANLVGVGVITAWGVSRWDYFTRSHHSGSEGWFQNDTESGGADKLGHLYTGYVTSHGLSALFDYWCFNNRDAALYGSLSALAMTGYMEIGDSFSDFGFSHEDLIANALGSVFGYYLYRDAGLSAKLDLRWEYGLHPEGNDFTTDYENSKYLFALKLNGFEGLRSSMFRHFEFHLGYYTRGFDNPLATKQRNVYLGIGLNLTDLFRRSGFRKTAKFLNYYQVPGTYVKADNDLND